MTHNTRAAARSRFDPTSSDAESLDRILISACAVIWLAALGSAVAATVALVGLGSGRSAESSSSSGTPWLLYGVIGVSALIIVGAIPLLVRARRAALDDPRAGHGAGARPVTGRTQTPSRAPDPRTQTLRSSQPAAAPTRARSAYPAFSGVSSFDASLPPAVDRIWLRCSHRIRDGVGAPGDRNRHLPDGRRSRHNLLGRICHRGPRHLGVARRSLDLSAPAARNRRHSLTEGRVSGRSTNCDRSTSHGRRSRGRSTNRCGPGARAMQ